ncbi:unnamed protein product [Gongylonema pulchrum]|uniref:Alpha/beta hydrolase n=1 Tax=Gongylonema pulchrum TaxID=637853 RepID=A0A183D6Z7_9BILA|nr:unnamed protein product [Gongylonema pulchrum]
MFQCTDSFQVYEELTSYGIKLFLAAPHADLSRMFDATDFHETVPRSVVVGHPDDVSVR